MNEIYNKLKSNSLFKNPYQTKIDTLLDNILEHDLDSITSPKYSLLTDEEKTTISSSVNNIKNQLTQFKSHTDRLSGVATSTSNNLMQIINITKTAAHAEGANVNFDDVLGSVKKINEMNSHLNQVEQTLSTIISEVNTNNIGTISGALNATKNILNTQILSDVVSMNTKQQIANAYAVAKGIEHALSNPAGIVDVLENILQNEALEAVKEVQKQFQEKLDKINDAKKLTEKLIQNVEDAVPDVIFKKF